MYQDTTNTHDKRAVSPFKFQLIFFTIVGGSFALFSYGFSTAMKDCGDVLRYIF